MGSLSEDKVKRRIRVLIVGPSLEQPGGQAVQAKRLIGGFHEHNAIQVDFLPVNPKFLGIWGAAQRVKYVRTVVTSIAYFWSLLRHVPHADVVHAFSASYFSYLLAPLPAMIVARIFGKRTILNYRSGEAEDHLANWRLTAVPTIRHFADKVVVPSGYLVTVFEKHGLQAMVISNFVPIDELPYRRRTHVAPVFLSNRNHESLYNVACSIRAFARVRDEYPQAQLIVAGDGEERAALESLTESLGVKTAVTFVGRVQPERMGQYYDAADIYINSPNIDNMPGSIVEAFACGLPVISTNAGGIPFIVEHGRTGLLCDCDDDTSLAACGLTLLRNSALALSIADGARAEALSRYVWKSVRGSWEELYSQMARRHQ